MIFHDMPVFGLRCDVEASLDFWDDPRTGEPKQVWVPELIWHKGDELDLEDVPESVLESLVDMIHDRIAAETTAAKAFDQEVA